MSRLEGFDPPRDPGEAYDEFWTAAEADLATPTGSDDPAPDPDDTYAAFHDAAGE